jgi:phosphate-selective porin OprO and OprP
MRIIGRSGWAVLVGALCLSGTGAALAQTDLTLRGRLHVDAAYYAEDDLPLDNGFLNRRTRLGISGRLTDDWSGLVEYEFAENSVAASDLLLTRTIGAGTLTIGHFKVPVGLSELTSANHLPFIERAANSNIMVASRRLGVGYSHLADPLLVQTMVFGRAIGDREPGDMPIGAAARVVLMPRLAGETRFHLGISAAHEDRQDYATLRFGDRPEARPDGKRLIDTGLVGEVSATLRAGLELALQSGPFLGEAEYLVLDVDRAGRSPRFSGYHVQASYVLTGEQRAYRTGVFGPVTPRAGAAWELAARYSAVDLNAGGFQGGEQRNVTLGVNYYVTANLRFMANYIRVDVNDSGAVIAGTVVGDEAPQIFVVRAQFAF